MFTDAVSRGSLRGRYGDCHVRVLRVSYKSLAKHSIRAFAKRTASLAAYRKQLSNYLGSRMNQVAPNLAALIGDTVGARLISKAGSLTNLSKYPASTVQILGAEKALFRALKTKGNVCGFARHSAR